MFILNKYDVNAPAAREGGLITNFGPNPATGERGDTANNDITTFIDETAKYTEQVISKIVAIQLRNDTLGDANAFNYLSGAMPKFGVNNEDKMFAAVLLGVFDPNVVETGRNAAGHYPANPPRFMSTTHITGIIVSIINDFLVIRIPIANNALFNNKQAIVQLYYRS